MKTITLRKHSSIPGAWVAAIGKRKVSIIQSNLQAALELVPNLSSVLESFNSTTSPGDRVVSSETHRLEVLAS
jgi:hypothetical protein